MDGHYEQRRRVDEKLGRLEEGLGGGQEDKTSERRRHFKTAPGAQYLILILLNEKSKDHLRGVVVM